MSKPMPLGKRLKDEEKKLKEERKLTFKGVKYDLAKMTVPELTELHDALRLDSRSMRRPLREHSRDENKTRFFLSRLRITQAKTVRREMRVKESNQ